MYAISYLLTRDQSNCELPPRDVRYQCIFTQMSKLLPPPPPLLLLLLLLYYIHLSLTLASLTTDAHSILSQALVFYLFTSIFLKSDSTSSLHLNLGLPFFPLSSTFFALQQLFFCPFTIHSYDMPTPLQSTYFNQSQYLDI